MAEQLPVWKSAMLSGSERLGFFSILKTKPKGHVPYLRGLVLRDGLLHQKGKGPQKVSSSFGIKPLLGYDTNINSGIPAEEFKIGNVTFQTDEEDVAKAGVTVGGLVFGSRSYSLAPAHVLKLSGYASYEYAPEHELSKYAIGTTGCLANHVASYSWLDSCAGKRVADKENSRVEETFASFGGSHVFGSQFGHHEARITLKRTFREDYTKDHVNLGLRSALADVGAVYTGISWGERVEGEHSHLRGATVSLTRPITGRRTTISASYSRSGGGTHFGTPREDKNYRVVVSSQVHEKLAVSLGYSWNVSDIDMYDEETMIFGLDFKAKRF